MESFQFKPKCEGVNDYNNRKALIRPSDMGDELKSTLSKKLVIDVYTWSKNEGNDYYDTVDQILQLTTIINHFENIINPRVGGRKRVLFFDYDIDEYNLKIENCSSLFNLFLDPNSYTYKYVGTTINNQGVVQNIKQADVKNKIQEMHGEVNNIISSYGEIHAFHYYLIQMIDFFEMNSVNTMILNHPELCYKFFYATYNFYRLKPCGHPDSFAGRDNEYLISSTFSHVSDFLYIYYTLIRTNGINWTVLYQSLLAQLTIFINDDYPMIYNFLYSNYWNDNILYQACYILLNCCQKKTLSLLVRQSHAHSVTFTYNDVRNVVQNETAEKFLDKPLLKYVNNQTVPIVIWILKSLPSYADLDEEHSWRYSIGGDLISIHGNDVYFIDSKNNLIGNDLEWVTEEYGFFNQLICYYIFYIKHIKKFIPKPESYLVLLNPSQCLFYEIYIQYILAFIVAKTLGNTTSLDDIQKELSKYFEYIFSNTRGIICEDDKAEITALINNFDVKIYKSLINDWGKDT